MAVSINKTQNFLVKVPLATRSYDDGMVVYNEISAETHLLEPNAGLVLAGILSGATDVPALRAALPELIQEEPDFDQQIQETISEFVRLGLIGAQGAG